jgi:hypothetical protein
MTRRINAALAALVEEDDSTAAAVAVGQRRLAEDPSAAARVSAIVEETIAEGRGPGSEPELAES